jgi:hypothetical protein
MFSAEEQAKRLEVSLSEAFVAVQVIDRAFQRGVILGSEAHIVGLVRNSLVANISNATGKNIDQPQQAAAPAADAPAADAANEAAVG